MPQRKSTKQCALNQDTFQEIFDPKKLDEIGMASNFLKRHRKIGVFQFLKSLLVSLSGPNVVTYLTSLCDRFNEMTGLNVKKKPFYNRLASASFPLFIRSVIYMVVKQMAEKTFKLKFDSETLKIEDILVHDGTVIHLRKEARLYYEDKVKSDKLRFFRLNVTMSGFGDTFYKVMLTTQWQGERKHTPEISELTNKLFLADAGYAGRKFFKEIDDNNGYFAIKMPRSWNPSILSSKIGLKQFVSQIGNKCFDEIISIELDKKPFLLRLIGFWSNELGRHTYIITNLDKRVTAEEIGKLYSFRWQIELCFKQLKSHCNLHGFISKNLNILTGLIWASFLVCLIQRFFSKIIEFIYNIPIAILRVARNSGLFIEKIMDAIEKNSKRALVLALKEIENQIVGTMKRENIVRDQSYGRYNVLCSIKSRKR